MGTLHDLKPVRAEMPKCISIEQAESALGIPYTEEQKKHLVLNKPSGAVLKYLGKHNMIFMPAPLRDLELLESGIFRVLTQLPIDLEELLNQGNINPRDGHGVVVLTEIDLSTPSGWIAIRKGPVPKTCGRSWNSQNLLLPVDQYIPNMATVIYSIVLCKLVYKKVLFQNISVGTSSVDAKGMRYAAGMHKRKGSDDYKFFWRPVLDDSLGDIGIAPCANLSALTNSSSFKKA